MERNVANIYEARRRLTAASDNVDSASSMTTLSVTNTFHSVSSAMSVYPEPGQYLLTADSFITLAEF